jgi:hypothetical protein
MYKQSTEKPIENLGGERLAGAGFLTGYWRLYFAESYLTILVPPTIKTGERDYAPENPEFCNILLSCMGRKLESAKLIKRKSLELNFDNGYQIFVSLRPKDRSGEALHLNTKSGEWWVW